MANLSVFFSYSLSKTYDEGLTRKVVTVAKDRVAARASSGWSVVDANEPSVGWIRDKVEDALRGSDALIAEATTWSPNVMYELGFARSNKCPIVVLINRRAPDNERLAAYYDFLGISLGNSLPADLGDIEYIEYSDDINLPGGFTDLKVRIDKALDFMSKKLSPGMRSLRRGERGLQLKTDELGEVFEGATDPPLLRLLGGWIEKVVRELGEAGSRGFLVSPQYYPDCFDKLMESERYSASAIADVLDETEPISILVNTGTDMSVNERIFLVSGRQFFSPERLASIFAEIRLQIERSNFPGYRVLIARADDPDMPRGHPFPRSKSRDLLLVSPDLVGGYEVVEGQSYLRVVASDKSFGQAQSYYQAVRSCAFPFDLDWKDAVEMKSAWLAREKRVGAWNVSWTFESRDSTYYDLYDFHIRTWVPGYEDFIEVTAGRVAEALLRVQKDDNAESGLRILEIGSGTGTLTTSLLGAIQRSRAASQVFGKLVAVDKAAEMVKATESAVRAPVFSGRVEVLRGTAFKALGSRVREAAPFGVICGSLVLSHLLQSDVKNRLDEVLRSCKEFLLPGGSIVLADALVPNPEERDILREHWRKGMVLHGLPPRRASEFLKNNAEMLNTATKRDLEACAIRHGFELRIDDIPGFVESPFRTITLHLV